MQPHAHPLEQHNRRRLLLSDRDPGESLRPQRIELTVA